MATYFTCANAKAPVIPSNEPLSLEDSRPDLLKDRYKIDRERILTADRQNQIEALYKKWCDLLFSSYNVVVTGPSSKFALLETFKKRFLDSGKILDWRAEGTSLKPFNIVTVRLHGLDPIKMEAFGHAILGIKETRRVKDSDYHDLSHMIKGTGVHFVFMIHSCEYFIDSCEEIFEAICKLYTMNPDHVHILMSSDHWNGGLRLKNLQHSLRLIYTRSGLPAVESFLWEKTELMGDFCDPDIKTNDTTMHRLFSDKTDLQSLKDIYQALDSATQQILAYIIKDLNDKSESNANNAVAPIKKRFQGFDAEDDEVHELKDEERADDVSVAPMRTRRTNNGNGRVHESRRQSTATAGRRSRAPKSISTNLDFQHLLKYCESKFIVRRGAALRDHLGELKDHELISFEDAGNKIQCLVDLDIGRKFLNWINET